MQIYTFRGGVCTFNNVAHTIHDGCIEIVYIKRG